MEARTNDTVDYSSSPGPTTVNLTTQTVTGAGGSDAEGDGIAGIESVIGGSGKNTLTGSALANMLIGGGVVDTIDGGAGNDTIRGGAGGDTLIGGAGTNDVLDYSTDTSGVTINMAAQTAAGTGSEAEGDIISGFESVIGGSGDDTSPAATAPTPSTAEAASTA